MLAREIKYFDHRKAVRLSNRAKNKARIAISELVTLVIYNKAFGLYKVLANYINRRSWHIAHVREN